MAQPFLNKIHMKKILSMAFALGCAFSFVSCEGEEDPEFVRTNYVAGTWEVAEIGSLDASNRLNYEMVDTSICEMDKFTFGTDMNYSFKDAEFAGGGTCNITTTNNTYAIEEGNIVLTTVVEGETVEQALDIIALTDKKLEVAYTDEETNKLVFLKMRKVTE